MREDPFTNEISRRIWADRYRLTGPDGRAEAGIEDSWRRIARALADAEPKDRTLWERRFYDALTDFKFLPGGRIQAGAGTGRTVTLLNCFVMGHIEDSMLGIFEALKEGALTMQQGGGVGYDFSTLRPAGAPARRTGATASGPVSFMRIWDRMCATVISAGNRRGAMMATLRCDHPDIVAFVEAKRDPDELHNFNLSVLVTDAFMEAVREDADWPLVFPLHTREPTPEGEGQVLARRWSGSAEPVPCRVFHNIRARELWEAIIHASYDRAEPGVLFIDRINRWNNLWYRERISATNPCGEIPLPHYGACDLGAINLTRFVRSPFTDQAHLDMEGIGRTVKVAVRMLDDVIDQSGYPLPQQTETARGARRMGLGITGLGSALLMLGLHYGDTKARRTAARALRMICHAAYDTSVQLAVERGSFPFFDGERYLKSPFVKELPEELQSAIRLHGIRNSHLTSIAPTGTVSLLANNVSSGIEPIFSFAQQRTIRLNEHTSEKLSLEDFAYRLWRQNAEKGREVPAAFVTAQALPPEAHLEMQAALQPYVDNAISKTINVPTDFPFEQFRSLFESAYAKDLKGFTTFRPTSLTGTVLEAQDTLQPAHCCSLDREGG